MDVLFFRPNAELSSLFTDIPMECIMIDDEAISETITDYHGNFLVLQADYPNRDNPVGHVSVTMLKTLIMSFDKQGTYIDSIPTRLDYSSICRWVYHVLLERGWLLMDSLSGVKSGTRKVNGKELLFAIKEDEAKDVD